MDLSPTGKKFKYKGVQIFRFSDGKIKNMGIRSVHQGWPRHRIVPRFLSRI